MGGSSLSQAYSQILRASCFSLFPFLLRIGCLGWTVLCGRTVRFWTSLLFTKPSKPLTAQLGNQASLPFPKTLPFWEPRSCQISNQPPLAANCHSWEKDSGPVYFLLALRESQFTASPPFPSQFSFPLSHLFWDHTKKGGPPTLWPMEMLLLSVQLSGSRNIHIPVRKLTKGRPVFPTLAISATPTLAILPQKHQEIHPSAISWVIFPNWD